MYLQSKNKNIPDYAHVFVRRILVFPTPRRDLRHRKMLSHPVSRHRHAMPDGGGHCDISRIPQEQ